MYTLQSWLGEMPLAGFIAQYLHKLPYSHTSPGDQCQLCQWDSLGGMLADAAADVMVCRQNEAYAGPLPRSGSEAEQLAGEGYTILVRHAERHDERLRQLAEGFGRELPGEVNVHVYATPADQFGFGWHYDVEDVFILQTAGAKEYSLRKNTVNPWPVLDVLPADMKYEREIMPLMKCLLQTGDWLYIPPGYWHMGTAQAPAISVAVGVMSPTALDIHDLARRQLTESILWRQRLPVAREAAGLADEELRAQLATILSDLASDYAKLLRSDRFLDRLIDHLRNGDASPHE